MGWEASSITDVEKIITLKILAHLALVSKRLRDVILDTHEHAALRITQVDAAAAPSRHHLAVEQFLLVIFEENFGLL